MPIRVTSALLLLWTGLVAGQPPALKPRLPQPVFGTGGAAQDPGSSAVKEGACLAPEPAAKAACWAMMTASYRYWASSYEHRRESFEWNLLASQIIFVAVLLLVFSGLAFAAIQFRMAFAASRPAGVAPATGTPEGTPAVQSDALRVEMEFSKGGVKVNSSVLGVIILLISMAFFYLYARYVYPIHDIRLEATEVSQGGAAK